MSARLLAAAKLVLGLAALAAVLAWLLPGAGELRAALARAELRPTWLALGLVATTVACLVTSARWKRLAEAMGGTPLPHVAYFHSLALTRVLGQLSSTLVMDLVGRGALLRAAGSRRGLGHAFTQAALERVFDLVLPLMLLAWAVIAWQGGWPADRAIASFVGVCLAFAGVSAALLGPLVRLALRLHAAALRLRGRPDDTGPLELPPLDRRLAVDVGLLSLARYLAVMLQFWAVAAAVGADLAFSQIAGATPIGQLAGMLGVTPGALGIQEAGWAGALTWVGVAAPAIALFVLAQRAIVTAYFALLAALTWPWLRRVTARRGSAPSEPAPSRSDR